MNFEEKINEKENLSWIRERAQNCLHPKKVRKKFFTLEVLTRLPKDLSAVAGSAKPTLTGAHLNMVLQTYGLSISSDDECIIDNSEAVISDRKGVNYSDNMLAMSPFAGDYPPATNYINYTDLDASYATQGKDFTSGPKCMLISSLHCLALHSTKRETQHEFNVTGCCELL